MKTQITVLTKEYELKEGTKTVYVLIQERSEQISEQQYFNITGSDTQKYFRRLGGSETAERNYTDAGYRVTKLTSKSPGGFYKVVRTFEFNQVN